LLLNSELLLTRVVILLSERYKSINSEMLEGLEDYYTIVWIIFIKKSY